MTPTESVMSESTSQPVPQAAASVSGHGSSLPPQTLPSYPVYKPTTIRVSSSDDVKSRPLSYHWLIGHCAEHIHVKPSVVERYVERLELLHIVPKNPHDHTERMMRSGLVRRCFKSVRRDGGVTGDTSRRRQCKLVPKFPPRKLL